MDVPYEPTLILGVFGLQLLLAFSITAFGVMVAARIKQMQSFMGVMQMIVMPMFFISGALFPVTEPAGLARRAQPHRPADLRRRPDAPARVRPPRHQRAARRALDPGVTWWGWHVPALLEVGIVLVLGLVMLGDRDLGVQRQRVAMAALRARGLVKSFGEGRAARRVLDGADLEVAAARRASRSAPGTATRGCTSRRPDGQFGPSRARSLAILDP